MAFVITKDHLSGSDECIIGPSSFYNEKKAKRVSDEQMHETIKTAGTHFRMYDDDDELYYEGYYMMDCEESDEFEPLRCFGMHAGATEIRMRNRQTHKYESL